MEKRSRTVPPGKFPQDSKADDVTDFIGNVLKEFANATDELRSEIKQLTASVEHGQLVKDIQKGKADMKKWQEEMEAKMQHKYGECGVVSFDMAGSEPLSSSRHEG